GPRARGRVFHRAAPAEAADAVSRRTQVRRARAFALARGLLLVQVRQDLVEHELRDLSVGDAVLLGRDAQDALVLVVGLDRARHGRAIDLADGLAFLVVDVDRLGAGLGERHLRGGPGPARVGVD